MPERSCALSRSTRWAGSRSRSSPITSGKRRAGGHVRDAHRHGEQECTRWGFRDLIEHRTADILQPDVAVVGGVTEWMKVAALASAYDLPVASHYFHDVHVHLMAAVPNALMAEYFPLDLDIMVFDAVVKRAFEAGERLSARPPAPRGLGMDLDEEKLEALPSRGKDASENDARPYSFFRKMRPYRIFH